MHSQLHVHIVSGYSPELTHRVAVGELDLAVVAAGVDLKQITATPLASSPLYVLLERNSELAGSKELMLKDIGGISWILFDHKADLSDSSYALWSRKWKGSRRPANENCR